MISFHGKVLRGSRRGTALGYPTINIPLEGEGVRGIYAAKVKIGEEEFEAAAFIDRKRHILEAHILDFDKDVYGWQVTIHLLKKIREPKSFNSDASLRAAIADDVDEIRTYFSADRA